VQAVNLWFKQKDTSTRADFVSEGSPRRRHLGKTTDLLPVKGGNGNFVTDMEYEVCQAKGKIIC